jgi:alpha-galactosidase
MGMELDLRDLDAADTATLVAGIAVHKRHRALIHSGDLVRLDAPDGINAFGIVASDANEALFSLTMVTEPRTSFAAPIRLAGLDSASLYALEMVWPQRLGAQWPLAAGGAFTGAALMQAGIQLPRLWPGTAVILHLKRC